MEAGDMKLQTDAPQSVAEWRATNKGWTDLDFIQRSNDAVKHQPIMCFCFTMFCSVNKNAVSQFPELFNDTTTSTSVWATFQRRLDTYVAGHASRFAAFDAPSVIITLTNLNPHT